MDHQGVIGLLSSTDIKEVNALALMPAAYGQLVIRWTGVYAVCAQAVVSPMPPMDGARSVRQFPRDGGSIACPNQRVQNQNLLPPLFAAYNL